MFKILACALLLASCNKNDVITRDAGQCPKIVLDSETGIYTVKAGRELTIAPAYDHAEDARFAWTSEGELLSTEPVLKHTWDREQELYIRLRVENRDGSAEEELKVEVLALTPPIISFAVPAEGLILARNREYTLTPEIRYDDLGDFEIEWVRGGKVVCTEKTYLFRESDPGIYPITINASNADGRTTRRIDVEVVETMPYGVRFPNPSRGQTSTDRYTFSGRPVYLRPLLSCFESPEYVWSVNGKRDDAAGRVFRFTPEEAGEYVVSVTVREGSAGPARTPGNVTPGAVSVTAAVRVVCVDATEAGRYRPAGAAASKYWNKVYEYTPAPGQFVNDLATGGFAGTETTPELAAEYAAQRLNRKAFVSLGSFGGYIIVGFDHSIAMSGGEYDFAIRGNAFDTSSEPGVVWVMQDINGNGLPDDEWYELRTSETGKDGTLSDYEVTYYRPADGAHTPWTDSEGNSGRIERNSFHKQPSYYPLWIGEESYMLRGTRLVPRNTEDPVTGEWINRAYDWGYADNMGSDNLAGGDAADGSGQRTGFRISNAIYPDGTPVGLKYIDFIKVQSAVLAQSGRLGEISTEVCSFEDLSVSGDR